MKILIDNKGRKVTREHGRTSIYWDGNMLSLMERHYADTSNEELASMLNVSENTVIKKARSLNLRKSDAYIHQKRMESLRKGLVIYKLKHIKPVNGFKVGGKSPAARIVIRLDTNEEYESATALARELGCCKTSVTNACAYGTKVKGIYVKYKDGIVRKWSTKRRVAFIKKQIRNGRKLQECI